MINRGEIRGTATTYQQQQQQQQQQALTDREVFFGFFHKTSTDCSSSRDGFRTENVSQSGAEERAVKKNPTFRLIKKSLIHLTITTTVFSKF
jgi:hypothetical protein